MASQLLSFLPYPGSDKQKILDSIMEIIRRSMHSVEALNSYKSERLKISRSGAHAVTGSGDNRAVWTPAAILSFSATFYYSCS